MVMMPALQRSGSAPGHTAAELTMSMAEIAELAGVRRPVVTTWRRRHPDFPAPVDGDALGLLFDARDVANWLIATGRDKHGRIEADLSLYTLAGLGAALPAKNLIALLTALICLRYLDDDEPLADGTDDIHDAVLIRAGQCDPSDEFLLSEVGLLRPNMDWLVAAVDDFVEAAWGCEAAFERIMRARGQFKAADLYASSVAPELARLIAGLSGAGERAPLSGSIVVTDLAAGPGDLLVAVADVVGRDYQPMFTVAEPDPYLARLVRRRLCVHGVPWVDMDVQVRDELPDESGDPDVIVTQIPYISGEARSPERVLDRLGDISVRLAPGSSAAVLGPADVLVGELRPYSSAERARAELLKGGMVEAVIRLPGGLIPFRPGYQTALWVLTSAHDSPWRGRVLLADVSDRQLTDDVATALVEDVVTWRRDGYHPGAHSRAFAVEVRVGDLIEPPRPLTVSRPRSILESEMVAAVQVGRVTGVEAQLDLVDAPAAAVRQPIRSGLAAGNRARPPADSIGSLAKNRRLIIRTGARLADLPIGPDGHHEVLGAPELLGRCRRGDRKIDRMALAGRGRARLTEPGDVIVTTIPEFGVMIDHQGLAVVEFPARILRLPDAEQEQFTPRVLAALLTARASGGRPAGAVRPPRRLEELEVPLLGPAEVRRLDELLAVLDVRRESAQREIDLLDELHDLATSGLVDGTLVLSADVA
jgi:hypothetical protein